MKEIYILYLIIAFLLLFLSVIIVSLAMAGIHLKRKYGMRLFTPYCIIIVTVLFYVIPIIMWPVLFFVFPFISDLFNWGVVLYTIFVTLTIFIITKYGKNGLAFFSLCVFFIISGIFIPKIMLNNSGYCFDEKRYLTDGEKINIAVGEIVKESMNSEFFKYSGIEEFFERNPNCCELTNVYYGGFVDGDHIFLIDKMARANDANIFVRIFYIYDYDSKQYPLYKERYIGLANCGGILSSDYIWLTNKLRL